MVQRGQTHYVTHADWVEKRGDYTLKSTPIRTIRASGLMLTGA